MAIFDEGELRVTRTEFAQLQKVQWQDSWDERLSEVVGRAIVDEITRWAATREDGLPSVNVVVVTSLRELEQDHRVDIVSDGQRDSGSWISRRIVPD